ncbi:MAG: hypothetical protein ACLP2Y_12730 [Limisphaerales bacterium]
MPSDLFEIDPAAIKSSAALLANRLVAVAKPRTPEQTLRIAFQGAVDEIARKLKFNLDWHDEFRLIGGRADTIYGGLLRDFHQTARRPDSLLLRAAKSRPHRRF